jgi:ureidoacrylate peracid hydrolase
MPKAFDLPDQIVQRVIRRLGRAHVHEAFDPGRTALVVIDMQNYFMAPGAPACCDAARDVVATVNRLAKGLRSAGAPVFWVQTQALPRSAGDWAAVYSIYSPDKQEARYAQLARGSEGFQLWPELDVRRGDEVVTKLRYSAFIQDSSDIESRLRARGIDTLLFAGVATNVCVESSARDAMMRGFHCVMVSDTLAAPTDDEHAASLTAFYLYFGDVQSADEVLGRMAAKTAAA